jgi:hypothetical protein
MKTMFLLAMHDPLVGPLRPDRTKAPAEPEWSIPALAAAAGALAARHLGVTNQR